MSAPPSTKRWRQMATVRRLTPSCAATAACDRPVASSRMIRLRRLSRAWEEDFTHPSSSEIVVASTFNPPCSLGNPHSSHRESRETAGPGAKCSVLELFRRTAGNLTAQPGARHLPFALDRALRDADDRGGLLDRQ